jgi:hypothetical protein
MAKEFIKIADLPYRYIYIVEDRNKWETCKDGFEQGKDVVLTLDFGLKQLLDQAGANVYYLDYIIDNNYLEEQNFKLHEFLNNWFRDEAGNDMFAYEGINVGNAFLLNILNDVCYKAHLFFCLHALREITHQKIIAAVTDTVVIKWLQEFNYEVTYIDQEHKNNLPVYFFPIAQWMNERIGKKPLKARLKAFLLTVIDYFVAGLDFFRWDKRPGVYIPSYYPTKKVIEQLKADRRVKIITVTYSGLREIFRERRISYRGKTVSPKVVESAVKGFKQAKKKSWMVDQIDLAAFLYPIIEQKVLPNIGDAYSKLIDIRRYFKKMNIRLMVPITDYWLENRLMMNYCKASGTPVFMIINGLLTLNFIWDGKDADVVNSYGEAIKSDYFKNARNVFCLGDPRMDQYSLYGRKEINRKEPTVIIGAAGYNLLDLNSHIAYEFDFMFDLLTAFRKIREHHSFKLIIKVRSNGYNEQYKSFVNEYFSDLDVTILWDIPFAALITQADLYISFYSQTVFEASSIGIPTLYYKKDLQFSNRPFDGHCELVTAFNPEELFGKIKMFYENDPCYEPFGEKEVMSKYIGPLDGGNAVRNTEFIYSLLK